MYRWKFGNRSKQCLAQVHKDMHLLLAKSLPQSPFDFGVIETARTEKKQRENIRNGVSWTMNSAHVITGNRKIAYAADILVYVDGKATYDNDLYVPVLGVIGTVALELNIPIKFGHFFRNSKGRPLLDSMHIELAKEVYGWHRMG